MHDFQVERWAPPHGFESAGVSRAERRTRGVIALTLAMMVAELAAGTLFGSMALLADGWHMATHAAALGITAFAYWYARRHAENPEFTFGTGKVGALGGFASAVGLSVVALLILGESVARLASPESIRFDEALAVAALGLAVNLASAWLLRDHGHGHAHPAHGHAHPAHGHVHDHAHGHAHHAHHDHNLRGAYLHVLADALTSVLAIVALAVGKHLGWVWLDPLTGVVGAVVIALWAKDLVRDTARALLDGEVGSARHEEVRRAIEADADNRVADLHVWRVGPRHLAVIVSVVTHQPRPPAHYKALLARWKDLAHVTVEVHECAHDAEGRPGAAGTPGT
jgi:cation diffusion facilitator family transporter